MSCAMSGLRQAGEAKVLTLDLGGELCQRTSTFPAAKGVGAVWTVELTPCRKTRGGVLRHVHAKVGRGRGGEQMQVRRSRQEQQPVSCDVPLVTSKMTPLMAR